MTASPAARPGFGHVASGRVVEIGIGSRLNLLLYPEAVDQIIGIDPSPGLLRLAEEKTFAAPAARQS